MENRNELYRLLLVDDETDVLQVMKKKIDWEALGFYMAGTAANGQEALELAEQMHIDVVLTDIKMPFMDGLTLCRRLKENYRNMKVVIYSGFDEFEYAREALHLEAEEYLLKPISSKDLTEVFSKIKRALDEEIAERRNMDRLNEYYLKSLPAMQEQLLTSILDGRTTNDRAYNLLRTYELSLESPYFAVSIIRAGSVSASEDSRFQLLNLSLKGLVEDYLRDKLHYYCINYLDSLALILLLDSPERLADVLYHLEQICKMADRILGLNTTAALGQAVHDLMGISVSFQEAASAMEYRAIIDSATHVIYINDIEPRAQDFAGLAEYNYQDILRAVKLGDGDETSKAVHQFINALKLRAGTPAQYQLACVELLTEFTKIGRAYQLDIRDVFGTDRVPWQDIEQFSSLDELEKWLLGICTNLRRTLRHERKDSASRLTEKAQEYIEAHYAESDLSAENLCHHLNVSAAYFSTIFKRECGLGFSAYLTKIRLEHAVQLLTSTEEKTYIIAEKVGYIEPNYFSYVFKKEYGISPSKYRASLKKEVTE